MSVSVNEDDIMIKDSPDDDMSYYIWRPFTVTELKQPSLSFDMKFKWLLKIQTHWREQEPASVDAGRYKNTKSVWSDEETVPQISWNRHTCHISITLPTCLFTVSCLTGALYYVIHPAVV